MSNLSTQNQPASQDHSLVFRRLSVAYGHLIRGGTAILIGPTEQVELCRENPQAIGNNNTIPQLEDAVVDG
jgi:hypothetical protein